MALLTLSLDVVVWRQWMHLSPTWPTTTACFRPGAGASTSFNDAVKTSTFSRTKQRVLLKEILSSGRARKRTGPFLSRLILPPTITPSDLFVPGIGADNSIPRGVDGGPPINLMGMSPSETDSNVPWRRMS